MSVSNIRTAGLSDEQIDKILSAFLASWSFQAENDDERKVNEDELFAVVRHATEAFVEWTLWELAMDGHLMVNLKDGEIAWSMPVDEKGYRDFLENSRAKCR